AGGFVDRQRCRSSRAGVRRSGCSVADRAGVVHGTGGDAVGRVAGVGDGGFAGGGGQVPVGDVVGVGFGAVAGGVAVCVVGERGEPRGVGLYDPVGVVVAVRGGGAAGAVGLFGAVGVLVRGRLVGDSGAVAGLRRRIVEGVGVSRCRAV